MEPASESDCIIVVKLYSPNLFVIQDSYINLIFQSFAIIILPNFIKTKIQVTAVI